MKQPSLCGDVDIREMFNSEDLKMLFINLERKPQMNINENNTILGKKTFKYYSVDNNIDNKKVNSVVMVPSIKLHFNSHNKMKLKLKHMIKRKIML